MCVSSCLLLVLVVFVARCDAPGSILEGSGAGFETPNAIFSKVFGTYAPTMHDWPDAHFVLEKTIRNASRPLITRCKKRTKIDIGSFEQKVLRRPHARGALGSTRLDFGRLWASFGRDLAVFWPLLGVSWPLLRVSWRLFGALGMLLGTPWL